MAIATPPNAAVLITDAIPEPLSHPTTSEPEIHRLSSSEPTQVTDSSVLPTMGGFYRGKVGGRY